jgi:hypothetical protein
MVFRGGADIQIQNAVFLQACLSVGALNVFSVLDVAQVSEGRSGTQHHCQCQNCFHIFLLPKRVFVVVAIDLARKQYSKIDSRGNLWFFEAGAAGGESFRRRQKKFFLAFPGGEFN